MRWQKRNTIGLYKFSFPPTIPQSHNPTNAVTGGLVELERCLAYFVFTCKINDSSQSNIAEPQHL